MDRCRRPGSASRVAATAASTAGFCTPAASCRPPGWVPGSTSRPIAGYVVLPPSRHPATGQPYRWAEPTLEPAMLPAGWRRLLAPTTTAGASRPPPQPPSASRGGSVAEAFNQATSWTQVLGPHGWSCPDPDPDADGARWRHPGATNPKSATIRHGLLFVYSAATPFQPTEPGAPRGYSRFRAYAVLEHGGDLRAAARALREATR